MTNRVEIDLWGGIFSWYQISIAIHFAAASQKEIQTSDIMYSYIVSQLLTSSSLTTINSPGHSLCVIHFLSEFIFSNFSCMFLNSNIFSNLNYDCSNSLDLRNLQEKVKKTFCYQKLFRPFTVWINCSSNLKNSSASKKRSFSPSLDQFFSQGRSEEFW